MADPYPHQTFYANKGLAESETVRKTQEKNFNGYVCDVNRAAVNDRFTEELWNNAVPAVPVGDLTPVAYSSPPTYTGTYQEGPLERVLEFVGELVLKGATILIVLFGIGVTLSFYLVPSIQATFPTVGPLGYFALAVAAGIGAGFAAGLVAVWLLQNIFWVAAVLALGLGIHFFA
jgi:hypothetical protein